VALTDGVVFGSVTYVTGDRARRSLPTFTASKPVHDRWFILPCAAAETKVQLKWLLRWCFVMEGYKARERRWWEGGR
jgi:hypothetical protein